MKLNKAELKELAEMVERSIINESKLWDDNKLYQQTDLYKFKSSIYVKIQSEYFGNPVTINEESIAGLLDIEFGVSQAASALGKIGGSAKTEAKSSASRENGKKGGRPKKVQE